MHNLRKTPTVLVGAVLVVVAFSFWAKSQQPSSQPATSANDQINNNYAQETLKRGREIFRFDTFGDESYWGDTLHLHQAIAGANLGGSGPGVSPKTALAVGLKVDLDALPANLVDQLKAGKVNLDDPATTLALLRLNSVVGVTGHFDDQGKLVSMGIQCALCHSSVDDALVPGIGHRLDGWANRDLNVGAIVSLAPNLQPVADSLGVDVATVKKVLGSWGPGCFDAELDKDGKGLRPDGKRACTLIPPAYGLAGVNLSTWTGFGSVTYWNAYVGATEMHGSGTFYDARLNDKSTYPVASKSGSYNSRGKPDQLTSKLAALHFYQLSIPAPKPPAASYDQAAATRGKVVFEGKGKCATCHVPPLYTEPGYNLHAPSEIGIDSFQADRSPTHMYRTAPLAGLWSRQSRGFFHDGRFQTLDEVIQHYNQNLNLELSPQERKDLVEFVKSL